MVSQEYYEAAMRALLQSVADMAAKNATFAGQLADAQAMIEEQQAKIAELEKPFNVEPLKAKT